MAFAILSATSITPPPLPRRSRMTARVFFSSSPSQISEKAVQSFSEPIALTLMYSTPSAGVLLDT